MEPEKEKNPVSLSLSDNGDRNLDSNDLEEDDLSALARFAVVTLEFCKWINCELKEEKIVQGIEDCSNICIKVRYKGLP